MLRGSRQGFTCNHLAAGKVNVEDQKEFPWGSLHDQPMRQESQTTDQEARALLLQRPSGDGTGGIKPDRKGWVGGEGYCWKTMLRKEEKDWAAISLFYQFQPHRWPQSTFFQGTSNHKRQFCSNFSINFDRRQSSPLPKSVYPSCIPQRINCRKGQWKTVGAHGETLPLPGSRRRGFSLAKQREAVASHVPNREQLGAPNSCSSGKRGDRKAWSHKLRCRASFRPLSKLVLQANAKWRNSHLGNNCSPIAAETCPLRHGLGSHAGFLPAKLEAALPLKGTEMFVLHWHLLTAVFQLQSSAQQLGIHFRRLLRGSKAEADSERNQTQVWGEQVCLWVARDGPDAQPAYEVLYFWLPVSARMHLGMINLHHSESTSSHSRDRMMGQMMAFTGKQILTLRSNTSRFSSSACKAFH